jgi:ATP-dependent Clp protease adaptor protein ClpS
MIDNNYTDTEELLELDVITEKKELNNIVLYNDDVNTFEWVIECLMTYCNHNSIQAEQ